jgi:hypothetical protein
MTNSRKIKKQWKQDALVLPDSIKKSIQAEVANAISLGDPRALTPLYITRKLTGKADIMALSTYAKEQLAEAANA